MRSFIVLFSLCLSLLFFNFATGAELARNGTFLPPTQDAAEPIQRRELPPLKEILVKKKTISELLLAMGVTTAAMSPSTVYSLTSDQKFDPQAKEFRVYQGIDAISFEADVIRAFTQGEGVFKFEGQPQSKRGVIISRYGFDNEKAIALLTELKSSDLHSVVLITDGPTSLDDEKVQYSDGPNGRSKTSNDIRPDTLKEKGQGLAIRRLLEQGFDLKSPVFHPITGSVVKARDRFITMSSHLRNTQIAPIMHLKETLLYVLKDDKKPLSPSNIAHLISVHGSANWTNNHYNRTLVMEDLSVIPMQHALAMIKHFASKNSLARISDVPSPGRVKMIAQDGTSWEVAYSDGKYELNQRMVDLLEASAQDPENLKIEAEVLSHFVVTNTLFQKAQYRVANIQSKLKTPIKIFGALDERFVDIEGYGLSATFAGYSVRSPVGRVSVGFPDSLAKNVEIYVEFDDKKDAEDIDPDGKPTYRRLWHDKTTLIHFRNKKSGNLPQTMISTGSFNLSNNFRNLERQDVLILPTDNPVVKAMDDSIRSAVSNKRKLGTMLPLRRAVLLKSLADFTGQTAGDLSATALLQIEKWSALETWSESQFKLFEKLMNSLHAQPSRLRKEFQVSDELFKDRMVILLRWIKWWQGLRASHRAQKNLIRPADLITFGMAVVKSPQVAQFALSHLLWQPWVHDDVAQNIIHEAYLTLDLHEFYKKHTPQTTEFVWRKSNKFRDTLLSQAELKSLIQSFETDTSADFAKKLYQVLEKNLKEDDFQWIPVELIQERAEMIKRFLTWYQNLPHVGFAKSDKLTQAELLFRLFKFGLALMAADMTQDEFLGSMRALFYLRDLRLPSIDRVLLGVVNSDAKVSADTAASPVRSCSSAFSL